MLTALDRYAIIFRNHDDKYYKCDYDVGSGRVSLQPPEEMEYPVGLEEDIELDSMLFIEYSEDNLHEHYVINDSVVIGLTNTDEEAPIVNFFLQHVENGTLQDIAEDMFNACIAEMSEGKLH